MTTTIAAAVGLLGLIAAPVAAAPQATTAPPVSTTPPAAATPWGNLGSIGSALGGAIPGVASASAGNAAGLLGYCLRNKLVSSASAGSILGKLTGQSGVATSPGYAAGQAGTLQTGSSVLSLDTLKGRVKTQICGMVLKRATSFL